jgi:hypothetical protein
MDLHPAHVIDVSAETQIEGLFGLHGREDGALLSVDGVFADGAVPLLRVVRTQHTETHRLDNREPPMIRDPVEGLIRPTLYLLSSVERLLVVVYT